MTDDIRVRVLTSRGLPAPPAMVSLYRRYRPFEPSGVMMTKITGADGMALFPFEEYEHNYFMQVPLDKGRLSIVVWPASASLPEMPSLDPKANRAVSVPVKDKGETTVVRLRRGYDAATPRDPYWRKLLEP